MLYDTNTDLIRVNLINYKVIFINFKSAAFEIYEEALLYIQVLSMLLSFLKYVPHSDCFQF